MAELTEHPDLRGYYNREYWTRQATDAVLLDRHDFFLDRLQARGPGRLLDVGSGAGTLLRCAVRRKLEAYGLDFSRTALTLSRGKGDRLLVEADCRNMPLAGGSFDFVVNAGGLEHVPETEQALADMVRVLKPGGRLCVIVPNSEFWLGKLGLYSGTGQIYERPRELADWRGLLEAAGLSVESVVADPGPPLSLSGGFRSAARSLARAGVMVVSRLLPLACTYQFVISCRKPGAT